jgi:homopolymeric O-antigen transport system permease protein
MTILARPIRDVLRYRELIAILVARDLKVRYKRSILGMLWTLLNPLLQMAVYTVVFSRIMRLGVPNYSVFLLGGLLPWTFISVGTLGSAFSLLNNQALIRKISVPQAVYPLSVVASKGVDLCLSLAPLAIIAAIVGVRPGLSWIFLPVAVAVAAIFTTGLALVFSSATVFFRDMRHLIDILFQVWFYVTPVLYPPSFLERLPGGWGRLLVANPAAPIVRLFQTIIYEQRFPEAGTVALASVFALAALGIGTLVFERTEALHIHYF